MELKPTLQDYTESEFQALVERIWNVDMHKEEHDRLIDYFDRVVAHPKGTDLLFYPDDKGNLNSPMGVVQTVKHWHYKQNVIPFKGAILPAPVKPGPRLSPAEQATARAKRELANAQRMASDIAAAEQMFGSALTLLEGYIKRLKTQEDPNATREILIKDIREIERTQHKALMAVRSFERQRMSVDFAKSAAQRNLTFNQADKAVWQANLQQSIANHGLYTARLSQITQRHGELHSRADTVLNNAWEQLVRLGETNLGTLYRLPAADNLQRPNLLISNAQPLIPAQRTDLQKTLRSAVAEFHWSLSDGAQEHLGQYAGVLNFGFASRAKAVRFGLCVALAELSLIDPDWQALAAQRGEVALPMRMSTATVTVRPGSLSYGLKAIRELFEIYITPCAEALPAKVRVRPAVWDEDERTYRFTTDGPQPSIIEWTLPLAVEATATPKPDRLDCASFVRSSPVPELASFNSVEEVRFDDYVVVFPSDSRLEPVYVMFNDRRDCPGVVSGAGLAVTEDWQMQAASSQGAPVPALVADQLRGQVFERFELFKGAFWKAVAATPTLNAQFSMDNRALLLSGSAPRSEQLGHRALRISHRVGVTQGGGVYDLDNLIVRG